MHLITQTGISVIDAAHILPHSEFRNDNPKNGLALCKTHHWLFDKGLMSVDERYRVMVSGSIENEVPDGVVTGLGGKDLMLPTKAEMHPHQVALEWHRHERYVK